MRTARLASLPLGYAGRATLGVGKRLRRHAGRGGHRSGPAAHRRAALQGARRAQGRRDEVRAGAVRLRGRAARGAGRALPRDAHQAAGRRAADAVGRRCTRCSPRELGADWRQQFAEFDDDPAAAASIGQVHRAVWHDGREVAVKMQYPGAGEALIADLRQIGRRRAAVRRLDPGHRRQAAGRRAAGAGRRGARLHPRGRRAAARFADGVRAAIPRSSCPRSSPHTEQVLVSRVARGHRSLARLITDGTQEQRDRYGELLRPVPVRRPGPGRAAARRPAPRQLPAARRRPARRRRLRRGRPAAGRAAADRSAGCCGTRWTARHDAVLEGLREEGFVKPSIDLDADDDARLPRPFVEPAAVERSSSPASGCAGSSPGQRPAPPGLRDGAEDQPAAGVPADPSGLARRHRRAVPARGERAVPSILAESLPGFAPI